MHIQFTDALGFQERFRGGDTFIASERTCKIQPEDMVMLMGGWEEASSKEAALSVKA